MKSIKLSALLLSFILILTSCVNMPKVNETTAVNEGGITGEGGKEEVTNSSDETTKTADETAENKNDNAEDENDTKDDMFSSRDENTAVTENAVSITLTGNSAVSDSDAVKISRSVITLSEEGQYIFSGSLSDGMIYVNAPDTAKLHLIFDGVSIENKTSAALYILSCDKVFVTLKAGSENKLSNGGQFTAIDDNNIDGAVFSKQDLTFNSDGSLTVESPSGHAVVCKDDLVFTGGSYTFNSASHGLDVNDSVRIKNASINIAAGKDGIHCENEDNAEAGFVYLESGSFDIVSEGDGISAGAYIDILGGEYNILSGGGSENGTKAQSDNWGGFMGGKGNMGGKGGMGGMGGRPYSPGEGYSEMPSQQEIPSQTESDFSDSESIKGIKAQGNISISGGTFNIDSADDALHSNADISISGGIFSLKTGDDGIHADEALEVSAGTVEVTESYEGLEALDIRISGGDINIISSDDGLNAAGGTDNSGAGGRGNDMFGGMPGMSGNGSIVISEGNIHIKASGDGIDANGTLEITGGYTVVSGPTQGDTATLDYDKSAVISGGTFIGTGAAGMAQTFSEGTQGVIAVSVGNQSAGTRITLSSKEHGVIIDHTPGLSFGVIILSSPEIIKGEEYNITVGDAEGSFKAS